MTLKLDKWPTWALRTAVRDQRDLFSEAEWQAMKAELQTRDGVVAPTS